VKLCCCYRYYLKGEFALVLKHHTLKAFVGVEECSASLSSRFYLWEKSIGLEVGSQLMKQQSWEAARIYLVKTPEDKSVS